jgi:hypothetical protein
MISFTNRKVAGALRVPSAASDVASTYRVPSAAGGFVRWRFSPCGRILHVDHTLANGTLSVPATFHEPGLLRNQRAAHDSASQKQNLMREMKPQRRQKGIGGKPRLQDCGRAQGTSTGVEARQRGQIELVAVQLALAGPEKDA